MSVLLIAAILLPHAMHPQVVTTVSSLEEAMQAYEDEVQVAVPFSVGINAARALKEVDSLPAEQVERLLRIAADGKAYSYLAPVVGTLVSGGSYVEPALRIAGRLPDDQRAAVVRTLGSDESVRFGLLSACTSAEQDDVAAGALWILVPSATPDDLVSLLRSLSELPDDLRRVRRALQLIPQSAAPRPMYEQLLDAALDLPSGLTGAIVDALAGLVENSPAAAEAALERANGSGSPLALESLRGIPAESWEQAREALLNVLAGFGEEFTGLPAEQAEQLAAAVLVAGQLRVPEVLPMIPALTAPSVNPKVRVAALRTLGYVGNRDASTIDLLIAHLEPAGPLADAAYTSLLQKAGVSLPHRAIMWREWRRRLELRDASQEEHEVRLAAERDAFYRSRRR